MGTGALSIMFKVYIPLAKQGINAYAKNYILSCYYKKPTYVEFKAFFM
jgi:hypothetical protein